MTAKRFTYDSKTVSIFKDGEFWLDGNVDTACNHKEICELLNELHEENQRLKQQVEDYIFAHRTEMAHHRVIEKDLKKENEQLKKELRIYRKVASCSNCKYHNYDWDIDDGYGGEEYEVCDKGNDVTEGICEEWVEL